MAASSTPACFALEFLDQAEETGQILFIDNWVMHEACRQVKAWQTDIPGAAELSVCVNLSPSQLRHPGLSGSVAEALRVAGLRPQDLVVELTEGSLVRDLQAAATELETLDALGCPSLARRLRNRLFVDEPSGSLPGRHHQDRPLVRERDERGRPRF